MNRTVNGAVLMMLLMVCLLMLLGCSMDRGAGETPANKEAEEKAKAVQATAAEATKVAEGMKAGEVTTAGEAATPADTKTAGEEESALSVGQASGSYTSKGETVELKYAYAGRGKRFGQDHESIIVLVTDKPIPADSVAAEIKSQGLLFDEKIRGLEYVIQPDKESYWVCFHPTQYQESNSGSHLEEFSVAGETVTGRDEDDGRLNDGRYKVSVRFVAAIVK
ncbi:MAG: hypothetical protein ABR568_07325 [Pyrinomonadaceae bacterium]